MTGTNGRRVSWEAGPAGTVTPGFPFAPEKAGPLLALALAWG